MLISCKSINQTVRNSKRNKEVSSDNTCRTQSMCIDLLRFDHKHLASRNKTFFFLGQDTSFKCFLGIQMQVSLNFPFLQYSLETKSGNKVERKKN